MVNDRESKTRQGWDIQVENQKLQKVMRDQFRENNYQQGKDDELYLDKIHFSNDKIEVKVESSEKIERTGNRVIEIGTQINGSVTFKPSGMSVTSASTYTFATRHENGVIDPILLSITTQELHNILQRGKKEGWVQTIKKDVEITGDYNELELIPFGRLVQPILELTTIEQLEWLFKDVMEIKKKKLEEQIRQQKQTLKDIQKLIKNKK